MGPVLAVLLGENQTESALTKPGVDLAENCDAARQFSHESTLSDAKS